MNFENKKDKNKFKNIDTMSIKYYSAVIFLVFLFSCSDTKSKTEEHSAEERISQPNESYIHKKLK